MVIIHTNYDRPTLHMLHTKLQDNQPTGSTEDEFLKGFSPCTSKGMTAIFTMRPKPK